VRDTPPGFLHGWSKLRDALQAGKRKKCSGYPVSKVRGVRWGPEKARETEESAWVGPREMTTAATTASWLAAAMEATTAVTFALALTPTRFKTARRTSAAMVAGRTTGLSPGATTLR